MEFLAFNLGRLTSFNTLSQSAMPLLHQLRKEVTTLVSALCSDLMQVGYIWQINTKEIDPNDEVHYVPTSQIYIGIAATSTVQYIATNLGNDHADVKLFYTHWRDFLIEFVKQIIQFRF